jgi:hypothetical protein
MSEKISNQNNGDQPTDWEALQKPDAIHSGKEQRRGVGLLNKFRGREKGPARVSIDVLAQKFGVSADEINASVAEAQKSDDLVSTDYAMYKRIGQREGEQGDYAHLIDNTDPSSFIHGEVTVWAKNEGDDSKGYIVDGSRYTINTASGEVTTEG